MYYNGKKIIGLVLNGSGGNSESAEKLETPRKIIVKDFTGSHSVETITPEDNVHYDASKMNVEFDGSQDIVLFIPHNIDLNKITFLDEKNKDNEVEFRYSNSNNRFKITYPSTSEGVLFTNGTHYVQIPHNLSGTVALKDDTDGSLGADIVIGYQEVKVENVEDNAKSYMDAYTVNSTYGSSLAYMSAEETAFYVFNGATNEACTYGMGQIIFQTNGTSKYFNLPNEGGTLAKLDDNVASASKLETPRKIIVKDFTGSHSVETITPEANVNYDASKMNVEYDGSKDIVLFIPHNIDLNKITFIDEKNKDNEVEFRYSNSENRLKITYGASSEGVQFTNGTYYGQIPHNLSGTVALKDDTDGSLGADSLVSYTGKITKKVNDTTKYDFQLPNEGGTLATQEYIASYMSANYENGNTGAY